jgi:hypothetical protein
MGSATAGCPRRRPTGGGVEARRVLEGQGRGRGPHLRQNALRGCRGRPETEPKACAGELLPSFAYAAVVVL